MSKPTKYNKLVIIKKSQIEMLLKNLRREKEQVEQRQQQLNPHTYNDYRWLIKAEESEDLGRDTGAH